MADTWNFTEETISVAMLRGLVQVTAHRHGDFGVHKHIDGSDRLWRITHLPSALCLAHGFPSLEAAASATVKIARLRNDWSMIADASEYSNDFKQTVIAIAREHGGRVGGRSDGSQMPVHNGYSISRS
jgi:hypothetical protein